VSSTLDIENLAPNAKRLSRGKEIQFGGRNVQTGTFREATDTWLVPQPELMDFLKVVEGFPPETIDLGAGLTITSYVPLRFPFLTNVCAADYDCKGVGKVSVTNGNYSAYEVNIVYRSPAYALNGPFALQSVSSSDGAKSVPTQMGFPWPVPGFIYSITMYRLSQFNIPFYNANSYVVNDADWRGVPRGRALFRSPLTREEYLSDGSKSYDITFPIDIAGFEHNYEVNDKGEFFVPVVYDPFTGQSRMKHLYVDFEMLFGR
jgi:hypothetical protein